MQEEGPRIASGEGVALPIWEAGGGGLGIQGDGGPAEATALHTCGPVGLGSFLQSCTLTPHSRLQKRRPWAAREARYTVGMGRWGDASKHGQPHRPQPAGTGPTHHIKSCSPTLAVYFGGRQCTDQLSVKCWAQRSSHRPSRPWAGMNSSGTDSGPFFFRSCSKTSNAVSPKSGAMLTSDVDSA